jgi:transcriptional regulator with XRE-family HTH domain
MSTTQILETRRNPFVNLEPERESFGERITRLREGLNINKAELARLTGITRAAIGQYESRDNADKCQVQHLTVLARAFGVSMDYLVNGKEPTSHIDVGILAKSLESARELLPSADSIKQAKLIKFVYTLDSQGQEPTPEILAGFYQALS